MSWHNWISQICTTAPKPNIREATRLCMCDGGKPQAAARLDVARCCVFQNASGGYQVWRSGSRKPATGLIQESLMLFGSPSDEPESPGAILIADLPSFEPKLGCRKS